jgi:biotin carboxyl carrier protein
MKFLFDILSMFLIGTIFVLIIGYPEYQWPQKSGDLIRFFDNEHWLRTTLGFIFLGLYSIMESVGDIKENMPDKDKFMTQLNQLSERIQNLSDSSSDTHDSKYFTIESPMRGTFYRTPGPDKDAFVNIGDSIQIGDKVCMIEAMKTFNEIESEISGIIVKVLVDNASPIDYDQPLFLVYRT